MEMFVNGENCALTSTDKSAGRRGLCGTMFIFKIAGAMAEAGESLDTIVATTKQYGPHGAGTGALQPPWAGATVQRGQ